jgi:outer membrane protein TolC
MGIVSLGGIVVRNAIILVDYIKERLREGDDLERAALEAGQRRLRPIFLTTMAAAVGVTPMILSGSSLWSPLASTIAVGLIVSMFFTLIVVPVIFVMVKRPSRRSLVSGGLTASVLVLALISIPVAYAAQRTIPLDEAVELAVRNNSMVKLASLRVKESEAKQAQMRANYFPQVANESSLYNIGEQQRITLPAGSLGVDPSLGAIPSVPTTIYQGGRSLLLAQTTITQPLTQLIRIHEGNAIARTEVDIARIQAGRARVEIAAKVRELYYTLLGLQAKRRAVQAAIAAAEERLKEGRDAAETGTALEVKAMQAQAALLESKQAYLTFDIQVEDAYVEFDELLGLTLDMQPLLVQPEKRATVAALEDLLKKAAAQNPELLSARQTVEKARHAISAAKADYIPDVGLFAQHIYQNGVPFLASNNAVFGVRLNYNLFDWGKRSGAVREREAQLAQAEVEAQRIERRIQIDMGKAYRRVQRVAGLVSVSREALNVRREALRITKDQFELGLSGRAAYEETNAAVFAADADVAAAEYQMATAEAELDRLAGSE